MDETPHIIYKITNLVNGKIYVGLTKKDLDARWVWHQKDARNNQSKSSYNRALMRAIRKYGADNFCIEQIDSAPSRAKAGELEVFWIRELKAKGKGGYNMTDGGEGVSGYELTDERRKQLSEQNSGDGNFWYGKYAQQSPHYGKELSEEHKQLLSEINYNNKAVTINGVTYRSRSHACAVLHITPPSVKTLENWEHHASICKVERLRINGWLYFGMKTTARYFNTSKYLFEKSLKEENYVRTPWTFDEYLYYTISIQKTLRPIEYAGVTYRSIKEACKITGKDRDYFLRLMREGLVKEVETDIYRPSHNSKPVEFCNTVFESKTRLMDYFGISGKEFNRLLESGEIKEL